MIAYYLYMPNSRLFSIILLFVTCITDSQIVNAQEAWQPRLDLLSAGAAASVVTMHICIGANASISANKYAATKLYLVSNEYKNSGEVYEYASSAFETKVKAMWQSTKGQCSNSSTLTNIALSTGFPTVNPN